MRKPCLLGVIVFNRRTYILFFSLTIACLLFANAAFAGWAVNGDAQWLYQGTVNEQILLTEEIGDQAGSAWIETQIDLDYDFDISFSIYLGDRDSNGADGISFALQNDPAGTSAFGDTSGGGEWIGMNGICPSVSVEVDTWQNSNRGDPAADHVGINVYTQSGSTCSGTPNHPGAGPTQADPSSSNIEDGDEHDLRITWNATTHVMTVYFDGTQRLTYTSDIINTVFGGDNMVYFGFAASTGGSYNEQYIIPNTPDVTADKTVSPSFVYKADLYSGTELTYTISILNEGRVAAIGTQITDTLPEGFHYVTGSTTGATTTDPTVTTSGGREVLVWDMSATPIPPYTGTMSISFDVSLDTDLDPGTFSNDFSVSGDNFGSISESQTADVIIGPVDVEIDKSHSSDFYVGQNGTFTFDVHNNGPDYCEDIVIEDTLPAGLTYVGISGTGWSLLSSSGQTYQWTHAGPLASGADLPALTVTVAVDEDAYPSVTNAATVSSDSMDQDNTNDSDSDTVTVHALADLSITKSHTGDFGSESTGSYDIVVTNNGPTEDPSATIYVMDTLPTGLTYNSVSGTGWSLASSSGQDYTFAHAGPLASGSSLDTLTVTVYASSSAVGTVINTATVSSAANDDDATNDTATDSTTVLPSVDLAVTKSHTGASFSIGDNVTFDVAVTNNGPNDETGAITVYDELPTGLTYDSFSGTGWSLAASSGQEYTFTHAGPLNVSASLPTLSIVATVGAAAYPTADNTVTVYATSFDPTSSNDEDSDTVTVEPLVDLSITKSHTGNFSVGSTGTYTIDVANTGSTADPGPIYVADTLPAGFNYSSASGTGWSLYSNSGQVYTFVHAGPLATGATLPSLYINVTPASGTIGTFTNTAAVSSSSTDTDSTNNTATDPTTVTDEVNLSITKTAAPSTFTVSETGRYSIVVSNSSANLEAGPIYVEDTLPIDLTYSGFTGSGWSLYSSSGQTYTFVYSGSLAGGDTLNTLEIEVFVQPGAYPSVTNTATVSSASSDSDETDNTDSVTTTVNRASSGNKPLYARIYYSGGYNFVLTRDSDTGNNYYLSIDNSPRTWTLEPVLTDDLHIPDVTQNVYLYLRRNGTNDVDVTVTLYKNGSTLIGSYTDTVRVYNNTWLQYVFPVNPVGDTDLEAGDTIDLIVNTGGSDVYLSCTRNGTDGTYVDLTTDTVISIDSLAVYDDDYASGGGSVITTYDASTPGSIYIRAVVSDPFGYEDIASASLAILDSSSGILYQDSSPVTTDVANTAGTRTFEWEIPITAATDPDLYTIRVTANEGTEGLVTDMATTQFRVYLPPDFTVLKTAQTVYDPYNNTTNPKAIPGAYVMYSVLVTNFGGAADANSFVMTDPIDSNIELYVGDLGASGSGPIQFNCSSGTPPCGLTYTFTSLASTTDDVDFSEYTTGTDFSYVPSGDADGFDDQVRRLRVSPKGTFAASGTDDPSCTIYFQVRVK
ncbi:conserved repeat domain protein [Desulfatibacillum aliphaticivorans]|uniref:Conserved repeat domain protein n=1 Tax=Desulfatibacillum aliphaticivorans TaxID=218208 RepID=B8F9H0_DESAL|nr:DUF11 domain-containing protein [Desulfatibacillum aliphaticivorans]ACL02916.1 conserved repeat domain protein [Desulfatibacillum aliphaticivorans]